MFTQNIIPKFKMNSISLDKLNGKIQPQQTYNNNILEIKTSENKAFTVEHNEYAQPLTEAQQATKTKTQQAELEEITAMKTQSQKLNSEVKLPQIERFTTNNGTILELSDTFNEDITNLKKDYSNILDNSIKLTITTPDNQKQELDIFTDISDRDIVDLREMKKIIGNYLSNLPEDTINKIIDKKVKHISISEDIEDIAIYDDFCEITSPEFIPPKRDYITERNFIRKDGCKIEIKDQSETSSILTITTPNQDVLKFKLEGFDTDKLHQFQIPMLQKMLEQVPIEVLKDLSEEIDSIRFMNGNFDANGIYPLGSNTICLRMDKNTNTKAISLVHELGHAIDNQNKTMKSKSPEFANKFEEFKNLTHKLGISEYSLTNPEEFFASTYAYLSIEENDRNENHTLELEKQIENLKDANNPDTKRCYELFQELKQDVQNIVTSTRNLPKEARHDNKIKDLVQKECQDIISEMNEYYYSTYQQLTGQSVELELINALSSDDEIFEKCIENYEKLSKNGPFFEEVKEIYSKIAIRLRELRNKLN